MKKFAKGILIGTAVVVLGTTAVFAAGAGTGTGSGTGSGAVQGSSSSSAVVPGNASTACPWCREDGHFYQDLDKDGVCDYYNAYTGENFSGHHGQESSHHGFQGGHHNSGQNRSSRCHGFCR